MRFIIGLIIFFCVCIGASARNLLENSSFEIQSETNAGMPENWNIIKRGSMEENHSIESGIVLDGKYAVRLDNTKEVLDKAVLIWTQSSLGAKLKEIAAGTEMEFSVYARAIDGPARARIYFESITARKCFIKNVTLQPGSWKKIDVKFKIEDMNYGNPYVCLQLLGMGSLVFDQAYLGVANQAPPGPAMIIAPNAERISNGGMESIDRKTGMPLSWSIIKRGVGEASVETVNVAEGVRSLKLSAERVPDKMLGWMCRIDPAILADLKPGTEMRLSLQANTGGNPLVKFRFYIEFMKKGKFVGMSASPSQEVYQGWMEKVLHFKMPGQVPDKAYVVVQLQTAGTLYIDDLSLVAADSAPRVKSAAELAAGDFCRGTGFPTRHTYVYPERPGELELEFLLPEDTLEVTLAEIDGPILRNWKFEKLSSRKPGKLKLKLPEDLGKGAYELTYRSGNLSDVDLFRIRGKQQQGVKFTNDHICILDGKPFFPIGIITPLLSPDAFRVYAESGINTVAIGVGTDPQLTQYMYGFMKKYHMAAVNWNNYGDREKISDGELRALVKSQNSNLSGITGFIGFMADESAWRRISLESIRRYYKFYFKYAPDYVLWQNHAPRMTGSPNEPRQSFDSIRRYSRAADVTGVDIYPVPVGGTGHNNLPNKTLSCVGDYTDLARKSGWHEQPVWMVLQAFAWSEEGGGKINPARPRPTYRELRFMAFQAVTHGATGIFWYGKGAKDIYSGFWKDMANVNRELNAASPYLIAGQKILLKELPDQVSVAARSDGGKVIVILVNEDNQKAVEFTLPLQGKFYESSSGKPFDCSKISMGPNDVLILTSSPLNIRPAAIFRAQESQSGNAYGVEHKTVLLDAEWTAHPHYLRGQEKRYYSRQFFELDNVPAKALLRISADDRATITVNEHKNIGTAVSHKLVRVFDITKMLKKGGNCIAMEVLNVSGPTGIVYEIDIDGRKIASGANTEFSLDGTTQWTRGHLFGKPPVLPWGSPAYNIEMNN